MFSSFAFGWELKIDHDGRGSAQGMMFSEEEEMMIISGRSNFAGQTSNPYMAGISMEGEIEWEKGWDEYGAGALMEMVKGDEAFYAGGENLVVNINAGGETNWETDIPSYEDANVNFTGFEKTSENVIVSITLYGDDEATERLLFLDRDTGVIEDFIAEFRQGDDQRFGGGDLIYNDGYLYHFYTVDREEGERVVEKIKWPENTIEWEQELEAVSLGTVTLDQADDKVLLMLDDFQGGFNTQGMVKIFDESDVNITALTPWEAPNESFVRDFYEIEFGKWFLVSNKLEEEGRSIPMLALYNDSWENKETYIFEEFHFDATDLDDFSPNAIASYQGNEFIIGGGRVFEAQQDDKIFLKKETLESIATPILGGEEDRSDFDIKLYPNPAKTELKVHSSPELDVKSFSLYGLNGNKIFSKELESRIESLVNLESIGQKGVFIAKIKTNEGVLNRKVTIH